MNSILANKLHEYPAQDVIDGSAGSDSVLDDCLNQSDGVFQLLHRYAGRTFCTPGKRLRLDAKSYYPDYMNGTGLDELWMCCTVPIVTGVIDTRTNQAPFSRGRIACLDSKRTSDLTARSDNRESPSCYGRESNGFRKVTVWRPDLADRVPRSLTI